MKGFVEYEVEYNGHGKYYSFYDDIGDRYLLYCAANFTGFAGIMFRGDENNLDVFSDWLNATSCAFCPATKGFDPILFARGDVPAIPYKVRFWVDD